VKNISVTQLQKIFETIRKKFVARLNLVLTYCLNLLLWKYPNSLLAKSIRHGSISRRDQPTALSTNIYNVVRRDRVYLRKSASYKQSWLLNLNNDWTDEVLNMRNSLDSNCIIKVFLFFLYPTSGVFAMYSSNVEFTFKKRRCY